MSVVRFFNHHYLADEDRDRVQAHGIPVDATSPNFQWIVCLDGLSRSPTDEEIAQMVSFRDFEIGRVYDPAHAERLRAMPLPKFGGHNTVVLIKGWGDADGWFFRRASWQSGPMYMPPPRHGELSLRELLDRIHRTSDTWDAWKSEHRDVFPAS